MEAQHFSKCVGEEKLGLNIFEKYWPTFLKKMLELNISREDKMLVNISHPTFFQ
jgi:hypothetical protein